MKNMKLKLIFLFTLLLLLTMGCTSREIQLSDLDKTVIENYIRSEYRTGGSLGNTFVAVDILGSDRNKEEVYIWALIEEYSFGETSAEVESGASLPFVLEVDMDDGFAIAGSRIPRDGSMFSEDVKNLFPEGLHGKILDYPSEHIEALADEMETKVEGRLDLSREHRLAVEKAIGYVMESPWENRLRIDLSEIDIAEVHPELADSLWTHDGPAPQASIDPSDLLVELGSSEGHDFAGLVFDIEKGEIIGYLPIQ
ncbi:MAG: hypothetical protein NUK57_01495 [Gudongella sp.]|nr:hypothetical protein [Gudongella sp.]